MTLKSIRDNIVLIATTFSRKDKSSPNISPNTNLKIEYIGIFNKILISLLKGLYVYLWDSLGPISDGGGGIRTHGTLADTLVFKTRALNHSTTPPGKKYLIFGFLIITKGG